MDIKWKDGIKFQVRENRAALVCGAGAIGFSVFIFIMHLLHPSERGGGALLYLPLLGMIAGGVLCLMMFFNKKLIVDEINVCYVNWCGKKKEFLLDEVGFAKIGGRGANNMFVVYDLTGEKLCKLGVDMRGVEEFHQYLVDNRIRVEWSGRSADRENMLLLDAIWKESSVCEEEIRKCSENFLGDVKQIFFEWENRNKRFDVQWEIGFAEYRAEDLEKKCHFRERSSSVERPVEIIPDSYECLLEAYLKQGEEYIVDSRGEEVRIVLPYLARSKSYQIGEGTRIRKTDEQSMKTWLEMQLETLGKQLPKHRYHTETFVLQHKLSPVAGLPERIRDIH